MTRLTQRASCIIAGSLLLTAPAAAQSTSHRLEARLDSATAAQVERIADSARAAGLPVEPLVNKALEGASKHADDARIVDAVRGLAQRLGEARAALGASTTESDLVAAAGALYQGVLPADMARLRDARKGRPLALPLVVLADLIERGVPPATATGVVMDVARTGASDTTFSELRRQVDQDIASGSPPAVAAAARARGTIYALPAPAAARTAGASAPTAGPSSTTPKP